MPAPEFLVIGHLVKDLTTDGWRPGGTARYASLVATRLGLRTAVLTSAGDDIDTAALLPDIEVVCTPSTCTTTFENVYREGHRSQFVRAVATSIDIQALPDAWRDAPLVLLGPVIGEVEDALVASFPNSVIGLSAQGWLRALDEEGRVQPASPERLERLLPFATAIFASNEDTSEDIAARWAKSVPIVAYTKGREGSQVWYKREHEYVPPVPANEVDPTGAGDAFASAFLVRWRDTQDAWESARFASACASLVVEGEGANGVPTREQIEARLAANSKML